MGPQSVRVAGGLALWVVVIVVAAGPRPDNSTWIGTSNIDVLVILFACVLTLAVVALLIWAGPGEGRTERSERNPLASLATVALIMVALVVWNSFGPEIDPLRPDDTAEVANAEGSPQLAAGDEAPPEAAVELRDLALLLIGGVVLAVVGMVAARRNRVAEPEPTLTNEDRYEEALTTARRRLATGDDPRLAVLHAYADLEEALAEIGRPRRPSDTVAEHHRRVLHEEGLDQQPFEVLASLYRSARFSSEALDQRDRETAIAALDRSRSVIGER